MPVRSIGIAFIALLFLTIFDAQARHYKQRKSSQERPPAWCSVPGYRCLKVHRGETWYSLFPDDYERDIVMRLNHANGQIYPGLVLKVPEDVSYSDQRDYAPIPTYINPPGEKVVVFNPSIHTWGAYDSGGTLVRWGPATGGADYCRDIDEPCRTKAGTFRIYQMGESDCISRKFPVPLGGAPMPYCMYFNGGQAFHGSPGGVVRGNVSHGCVRLFVNDAEWLRYDFVEGPTSGNGYRGTKVIILPYESEES